MQEVTRIEGKKPGPTSVIMVGNHGNETCGMVAFDKLLPDLKIYSGTVYFILGNPRATEQGVRFTEANLNRMFKPDSMLSDLEINSYEYTRAQFLKQYFDGATALLDIHSSSTMDSVPFIICEKDCNSLAWSLPAKFTVNGFAELNPGGAQYYMYSKGKVGIAIECGQHNDLNAPVVAKNAIITFLRKRGHIPMGFKFKIFGPSRCEVYKIYKSKTRCFTISKHFDDFEIVPKGMTIGIDGNESIYANERSIILFAKNSNTIGDEVFVLGRNLKTNLFRTSIKIC